MTTATSELVKSDLHQRLRKGVDPDCELVSDSEIQEIIKVSYGLEGDAIRRMFLAAYYNAFREKNEELVTRARRLIRQYELGILKV